MAANRLLTIDDDPAIGAFIGKVAKSCDFEAVATTRPETFKERVENWRPTHITLDLKMPNADGIELLRFLVAQKCDAKILLVSGFEPKVLDAAHRFGGESGLAMSGTLTKPIRADDLRRTLNGLKWRSTKVDEPGLIQAIEQGELFLVYQPKVKIPTLEPIGYEALVRWQHPVRGLVPPMEFIPLAEACGHIDRLTETVIELGLGQLANWGATFEGTLAVNISGRTLNDLGFVDRLAERCSRHGIGPERLVLEITESSAMADALRAMDILTRLRLKGFRLSIDDFGTGYSSLLQLARLPFSELKVDKTFVLEAHRSAEARAIVKSTIDLAHNLGLRAVAEGVETQMVMQLLADLGCDVAQGYHIAKPLAANAIDGWRRDWEARRSAASDAIIAPQAAAAAPLGEANTVALTQSLIDCVNPLWELGRNSLIGWRPTEGGIDVLMVPYQNIVDRFTESQRLLHGKRLMGEGTFRTAQEIAGLKPVHIPLHYRVGDEITGSVPTDVVEQVLRRYGITETRHCAVALFDIVGFTKCVPRAQVAQLNSLECSISTAQGILQELGKPIDLARTTTGDGFYIWNREKGAQADLDTYLLAMLVLADNAISRREGRSDMVPELRSCFSVGPHYSYHQVDGLDPRGHDYIVGDVTITLARMVAHCLPGQILIGDFSRPVEGEADAANPLELVIQAAGAFERFNDVRLHGRTVKGARCYLTGEQGPDGRFDPKRFSIRDKHGFDHFVFNQKFNIYLTDELNAEATVDAIFLGKQQSELVQDHNDLPSAA